MESLAGDLGFDTDIKFTRLAVTPEQVRSLQLPIPPAKPTDQRPFSGQTVRCEAIRPDELARIIRTAIEERLDQSAYGGVLAERKWPACGCRNGCARCSMAEVQRHERDGQQRSARGKGRYQTRRRRGDAAGAKPRAQHRLLGVPVPLG